MRKISIIVSLTLCTAGCASGRGWGVCPKPPKITESMAAPPPGIFSLCLREILDLADNQKPMSDTCSMFLKEKPTE